MDDNQIAEIIKQVQRENNFPGLEKLIKLVQISNPEISRSKIKTFLSKDLGTQLTQVQQQKHTEGHIVATKPDELWQFDIFDLSRYKQQNKEFRYLMACMDVFTRKAWVEPMRNKDSDNCAEAFDDIIKRNDNKAPRSMISDQDRAFIQGAFQKMVEKREIALNMNALKDHRALGIIDNFAKRIKDVLTKTFLRTKNTQWLDIIQKIVERYNKSSTAALHVVENLDESKQGEEPKYKDLSPNEASQPGNFEKVLDINMNKGSFNKTTNDLKEGDKVRKTTLKGGINKGTDPKWSDTVYMVVKVKGNTVYLNDDSVMKRTDLLKVSSDSEFEGENVIAKTKKANAKDKQKENQEKDEALKEKRAKNAPPVINVIPVGPGPVPAPKARATAAERFASLRATHGNRPRNYGGP